MSKLIPTELAAPIPDLADKAKQQGLELTPPQQKAVDEVVAHFSSPDYTLSGLKEGQDGALLEEEKFWLVRRRQALITSCSIIRYLRATKWQSSRTAIKRLEDTLRWRREFGLYDERHTPAHVEPEALTGKEIMSGFDTAGRPALYLCPERQNTDESIRQIEFLIFMVERSIDFMGPGVESLALMVDYGRKSAKSPSFATSRSVLNILQTHYPERLGRALIINVPWVLNAFYKLITPLIDPVTRDKMRFNPDAVADGLFTADSLWKEFGGSIEFNYKHEAYWTHFVETSTAQRKKWQEKWRVLGGKPGIKEWDYKQAEAVVSEKTDSAEVTTAPSIEEASVAGDAPL
ncbi:CRAL/TRIO domain-containing protein [Trametopsis cervina]|nr:CRAL/TRIO domain-containing protein [Trametopsis cervina]